METGIGIFNLVALNFTSTVSLYKGSIHVDVTVLCWSEGDSLLQVWIPKINVINYFLFSQSGVF